MEQLSEELVLLSPLQLHCLPSEGSHSRFSLSAGNAPPIELGAESEMDRQRWMLLIGESVCPPSPPRSKPPSPDVDGPAVGPAADTLACAPSISPSSIRAQVWPDAECLDGSSPKLCSPSLFSCSSASSLKGRVQLARSRVADNYSMGKILAQGDDYMVVEGLHLATQRSHALKLLSKQSPRFVRETGRRSLGPRVCCRLLAHCIEEVYEGPNHVALVMHWGTHELDSQHDLSVAVLEALRLLRELLPPSELPREGLKLSASDLQKLMARLFAIDSHLQANLFI